jgi:hypothetical protein
LSSLTKQNKIIKKLSTSIYGRSQRKSKITGQVFFAFPHREICKFTIVFFEVFSTVYKTAVPDIPPPLHPRFHQLRQPDRAGIMIIILVLSF